MARSPGACTCASSRGVCDSACFQPFLVCVTSFQEPSKEGSGGSSKGPKPHKLTKEHRERPRKDSESKATSKDDREGGGKSRDPSSSSSSKKPSEIKVKEEVKVLPKAAFKEPKLTLKESKMEGMSPKGGGAGTAGGGGGGGPAECKALGKRPATVESPKPSAKKQKKGSSEGPKGATGGAFTGTSPRVSSSSAVSQAYPDKKPPKDKGRWAKGKNDTQEPKEPKKLAESEESNSEEEASSKSEVFQTNGCLLWRDNGAAAQRPPQHFNTDKTFCGPQCQKINFFDFFFLVVCAAVGPFEPFKFQFQL